MTILESDLNEKKIRKKVRSSPDTNWAELVEDILAGNQPDWDLQEDRHPHTLGWLFQYSRENERKQAFRSHIHLGDKHESTFQTTQIFTPRWIADLLCEVAITKPTFKVHDPAVGAGQFLLAAYERLKSLGVAPETAARQISGSDLDENALRVADYVLRRCFLRDGIDHQPNLQKADLLSTDWDVDLTLTNPPFLGRRSMNIELQKELNRHRPFHFDLFAATIHRIMEMNCPNMAIIAPQSFWFIERFREARLKLLDEYHLSHFYLFGSSTFQALSGAKSTSAAFCLTHKKSKPTTTEFFDLRGFKSNTEKIERVNQGGQMNDVGEVIDIPGNGLSFFLPNSLRKAFETMRPLGELVEIPGGGNKTANNKKYLKKLNELPKNKIRKVEAIDSDGGPNERWVVYSKGGKFAPWWGNWEYAVDWSPEAQIFYDKNRSSNLLAERYRFRPGLTYSDLSSVGLGVRRLPAGTLFDMTGPAIFEKNDDQIFLDGLMVILNSTAVREIVKALNPTLHIQVGDLRRVPIPSEQIRSFSEIGRALVDCVQEILAQGSSNDKLVDRFLALEYTADKRVCELYGFSHSNIKRLKHHKIKIES